jgi:segregation and condensation protein B
MVLKAKIEATLFVTGKSMTIKEISEIVHASNDDVEEALLDLIMDYSSRDSALEIDDEDGYILQVKSEHYDIVEKLMPIEMNTGAIKTLSAIALKQPVLQSDLVNMMGMNIYDHINYLSKEDLISKTPKGKSYMIKTTAKFHEYFKLKGDVKDLAKMLHDRTKKTLKT